MASERPALRGERASLSYGALAARCAEVAGWGLAQGLGPGDVVGLFMENAPDYAAVWLGLTRIGCVVALFNTQTSGAPLAHAVRAASATQVIVGDAADEAKFADVRVWQLDEVQAPCGAALPPAPPPQATALLIYTSGTTGFPKATKITHGRVQEWSHWFAGMMDARAEDILYNCLPMYHSIGGVVAIGAMLVAGGSVVIRRQFSASRFWDDVIAARCTIFQYIGELCRYLLNVPGPVRAHALRLCCGNGLRADVWEAFQARFAIPRILEFYAATEGNVSLYNCEGKPGAIGRVPPFLAHRFPVALIRCDPDSGAPLRGADGLCIGCENDAPGEAIGAPPRAFDGYTDAAATQAKQLRDVFKPGDVWLRTGDLMRRDAAGFYYFLDRLGDNFRWKGENISSTEVATVLGGCAGVVQALLFGVPLPGHEGRAGMAVISVDGSFSIAELQDYMTARLPGYARPLFLRPCSAMDITGTFKLRKERFVAEGLESRDPVWLLHPKTGEALLLTPVLRADIAAGRLAGI